MLASQSWMGILVAVSTLSVAGVGVADDGPSWVTEMVSVAPSGASADAFSITPSMAAERQLIVFTSRASNLVAGDNATCEDFAISCADIFLRDLETGAVRIVSLDGEGQPNRADPSDPVISADGTTLAFESRHDDFIPDDDNGVSDIIVVSLADGLPRLITRTPDGRVQGAAEGSRCQARCGEIALSADGRFVFYSSWSSDLVANDTNDQVDVFRYDRERNQTIRASVNSDGGQLDGPSWARGHKFASADGRYVVFSSDAPTDGTDAPCKPSQVFGGNGRCAQVYLKDLDTGLLVLVSRARDGAVGNGESGSPTISPNGHFVVFSSGATNLVPGDRNDSHDVFIYDVRKADLTSIGGTAVRNAPRSDIVPADRGSYAAQVSNNGVWVAFLSNDPDFHPVGVTAASNLFVWNTRAQSVQMISKTLEGGWANENAGGLSMSPDGGLIAWSTAAHDIVLGDEEKVGEADVFLSRRVSEQSVYLGTPDANAATAPAASGYVVLLALAAMANLVRRRIARD